MLNNESPQAKLDSLQISELELDTDDAALRKDLSNIPEMGSLSALTDVIRLLFNNIDQRLSEYLTTANQSEKDELQKEMKQFLNRINANHLIPLHFRIKVLRSFAREANFLNADLTSAILRAYQVGILLLLEDLGDKEGHLLALGKMCEEAIQLAMHVSQLHLEQYRELGFRITNQVHALARNGLGALAKCPDSINKKKHQDSVRHGLAWFEIMRTSDFFSLQKQGQMTIFNYIETCMKNIQLAYIPKQSTVQHAANHTYLLSYVGERQQTRPERVDYLEPTHKNDRIIIDISTLIPILKDQMKKVQEHLQDTDKQQEELRIEEELLNTLIASKRMLTCMHKIKRRYERKPMAYDFTIVESFSEALKMPNKASFTMLPAMGDYEKPDPQTSFWSSFEQSSSGMGAESSDTLHMPSISNLVRIVWQTKEKIGFPFWAKVIWLRHLSLGLGRSQIGLQFLPGSPFIITMKFAGQESSSVLAVSLKGRNNLLIWTQRIQVDIGRNVIAEVMGIAYIAKVLVLVQHGNNYISYKLQLIQRF